MYRERELERQSLDMTVTRSNYQSTQQQRGSAQDGSAAKLPPPPPPPPPVTTGKTESGKSRPPPYSAATNGMPPYGNHSAPSSMSSTPSSLSIAGNAFSAPGAGSISFPEISHDERQRIRRYWFSLDDAARRSLVMLEKEAILNKLKETRATRNCQCPCCGRSK